MTTPPGDPRDDRVPARARRRDWGTTVTRATGAFLVLSLVYLLAGVGPAGWRPVLIDVAYLPIGVAALVLAVRVVRERALPWKVRRAWYVLTVAFGLELLGNALWFWAEVVAHRTSYPSVSDIGYLGFMPVLLAGLLMIPTKRRQRDTAKLVVDVITVLAAGFVVIWYLVLGPTIAAAPDTLSLVVSVAYSCGDLVLILGMATVLLRGVSRRTRRPLQILLAGLQLFLIGDVSYGYLGLHEGFVGGTWPDVFWLAANYGFVASACDQYRQARRPEPAGAPALLDRWVNRIPYAAVGVAYVLLALLSRAGNLASFSGMLLVTVALTTVIALRQLDARAQNRRAAVTDGLTGLSTRALLQENLRRSVRGAARGGTAVGVLLVDLDRFKSINDAFGHDAGDAVLVATAEALRSVIRENDSAGRLGGDEFAVVVEGRAGSEAEAIGRRIQSALQVPVICQGHVIEISASIGIAVLDGAAPGGTDLLLRADIAMRAAKQRGPGHCVTYSPGLETGALEAELRQAIERDELAVHYQPIIDLTTGAPTGLEALVRWDHPTRGHLPPDAFIPLAEESGLIVGLGACVLRRACEQLRRWREAWPAADRLTMAVNVSPRQVLYPGYVATVSGILQDTRLPAHRLVLELTESSLLHDDPATVPTMEVLRELGVRIAVDDFGTGYASVAYLRRLPLDVLKIDRSFVGDLTDGADGRTIGKALVDLGLALHLEVVAEGIETAAQASTLRHLHCRHGQGFHFARPMPPDGATEYLRGFLDRENRRAGGGEREAGHGVQVAAVEVEGQS